MAESDLLKAVLRVSHADNKLKRRKMKRSLPWMVREGEMIGDYIGGELCGKGGFAFVRHAYHLDDEEGDGVVIKSPNSDVFDILDASDVRSVFENEASIIDSTSHPNIVSNVVGGRKHEGFSFGGQFHIPMEHLERDISAFLGGPSEDRAYLRTFAKWLFSAGSALDYLHNTAGIVHCDISPSQFMTDHAGNVKLCDFSVSRRIGEPFQGRHIYNIAFFPYSAEFRTAEPCIDLYCLGKSALAMLLPITGLEGDEITELLQDGLEDEGVELLRQSLSVPFYLTDKIIQPCIDSVKGDDFTAKDLKVEVNSFYHSFRLGTRRKTARDLYTGKVRYDEEKAA